MASGSAFVGRARELAALRALLDAARAGTGGLALLAGEPATQEMVKHEAGHCPGGRLVAWYRATQPPHEPDFEPSLGLVEDPQMGVSGPLWVGKHPIRIGRRHSV